MGQDTFVFATTGGGKSSVISSIRALLFLEGTVIVPLDSLMKNQVDFIQIPFQCGKIYHFELLEHQIKQKEDIVNAY